VKYFDGDDDLNWIAIDLSPLGRGAFEGLLLEDGIGTIDLTIGMNIDPGTYNLTITAMDLDRRSDRIVVTINVLDQTLSETDDVDSDQDGIPDWWEEQYGLDPSYPGDALEDWNKDGLTNLQEFRSNGNPLIENSYLVITDIDFDGLPDWWEELYGLDPLNSNDADEDMNHNGIKNIEEYQNGADPAAIYKNIKGGGTTNDSLTEKDLERWNTTILIIMMINGLILLFSIILFLLERRWRKKSMEMGQAASKKDIEEMKGKIDEQNALINELVKVINENELNK